MKKLVLAFLTLASWCNLDAQISAPPGKALGFNGTNQYVQVNSNAALETANTTVEAWVRPQWASGTPAQLPCIVGMSKPGASRYDIYINKNYSGVTVWNNSANLSFGFTFTQNQLYHIALVFGSTTSSLYVNGYHVNTISGTLNNAATAVPMYIGSSDGTKEYFNGNIDEVRIWNVARTSQQIRENMHLVLTGSETGLVSYYQFNEGSGTTTADAKSSFTGTLTNSPSWLSSSFPFGGGTVNTQSEVNGAINFPGINLTANYASQNAASITAFDVVSPAQAYALPSGAAINTVFNSQYWVVNRFGSGSYNVTLAFKTSEDMTSNDAAHPSLIQLYQRNITSDGGWTYAGAATSVDDVNDIATFSGITTGLGEYVLARGYVLSASVSGTSFCAPSGLPVTYDGTGITYNAGNVFTAQVSNAAGSFASPATIGSVTSTSSTGSIPSTLSPYLPAGAGYKIRVVSSNPVSSVVIDNGTALTIANPLENATFFGLASGLAAQYHLDGNANDSGPNMYDGSIVGGVTATTDRWGNASSAMGFNGTNSGIDVGNAANLRMYSAVSISAWINIPAYPSSKSVIVTKYFNTESYQLYIDNLGRLNLLEGSTTIFQTSGTVPLNQWVHVVGTTTSANWKLYMNGVQVGTGTASQSFLDSGGSFQIGKDGSSNRFTGSMDELRVYNRVLTPAEVQVLFNDGIASNTGPVCQGGTVTLSALTVAGATYSWTGPNSFSSGQQNPPSFTSATTSLNGTYTLTTTKNGCSSPPQRTIVVVNVLPAAPGVIDVARCSNGTVILTASGSTNGNYRWYTVSSGGSPIGGAVNASYTTPSLSVTTPYWVSIISTAGCEGPRAQINAIINTPIDIALVTSAVSPVCAGVGSSVSITGSEASATYQVFRGATLVSGSVVGGGLINLPIPAGNLISGTNALKVTATKAGCGSADLTNTVGVTVNDLPAITAQPVAQNKCTADNVSFSVTATGTALAYQWRLGTTNLINGGAISGATSTTLTITGLVLADAGNYNCVVSGTCAPSVTSANAALAVVSLTSISSPPANDIKCVGQAGSFSVTASAPGSTLTYQWRKGTTNLVNGGNISGATSATLTLGSVSTGDGGNYNCVITGGCNPVTSADGTLTVNLLPAITGQPSNDTQCVGSNSTFSVTASGSSLTYQWRKGTTNLTNGGAVSGAFTATLTLTNVTLADAGNYNCVVSGACAPSVTSGNGALTVISTSTITSQPSTDTKCAGQSSGFSVVVSSPGSTLTYQWRKGTTNLTNGGPISGATTATLTIGNLTSGDAGNYNCVISGGCNPVTSSDGILTVNTLPAITSQPADDTKCAGSNTSFSVTATGSLLTYQWRKGTTNLTNGGVISGVNTTTLTLTGITISDAGTYNCVVTGVCAPAVTSSNGVLTVSSGAAISGQPANDTKCVGATASFSVTASGSGLTYQWRKGTTALNDGGNISGATTASLILSSLVVSDAGNYNCIVSAACGSPVTSANGSLAINASTLITVQPNDDNQCTGSSTNFSVTATGTALNYQWKKGSTNLSNGGSVSGANGPTLSISGLVSGDAGSYACVITGTCGLPVTSTTAMLTVNLPVLITAQPANTTSCATTIANFDVTATGSGLTYQWRKGTTPLNDGAAISGAKTSSLTLTALTTANTGVYNCVVTGSCNAVTSSDATLGITSLPSITGQPADATKCAGQPVSFTVAGSGAGLSYQWRTGTTNLVDDGNITGATTPTINLASVSPSDAGNYNCVVSGTCTPPVISTDATLTVTTSAVITSQPASSTKSSGQSATISVTSPGGTGFQWRKGSTNLTDGVRVTGATTSTLVLSNLVVADAGNYNCVVTNPCGSATSADGVLSVNQTTPVIVFTSPSTQGTEGDQLVISATSPSPAAVVFSISGGTGAGNFINATTLKLTLAGTIEIAATQGATADYFAATAHQTILVSPDLITGIANYSGEKPQFYPNPVRDHLFVRGSPGLADRITLIDARGVIVRQWIDTDAMDCLPVDGFAQGIYLVKAYKNGKEICSDRILIN